MNALWEPYLIITASLFVIARAEKSEKLQSCHVAQLQCHARSGCQMALNNFFIHCHSLIKGEEITSCPTDCKHALVSLLSTEDQTGLAFINCNCQDEDSCAERKRRVEVCQIEVLESMHVLKDDAPPVTCNLARWICEADTSCLAALKYYYDHCSRLFSGIRCTSKCRNSLQILSRQPHASRLRSCLCDGSEDYDCHALKANTETLCLRRKTGRLQKSRRNSTEVTSKESTEISNEHSNPKQSTGTYLCVYVCSVVCSNVRVFLY